MPELTQYQIQEALKRGVSQEQINTYVGKDVFKKQTIAENIGDYLGITPTAKRVAGNIAQRLPIPTVVKPANYQGTQDRFQREQQKQFAGEIEKEMPTLGQQVAGATKLGLTIGGLKTPPIANTLRGRTLEFGVLGATMQALDNIQRNEPVGKGVGTAGVISAAIPVVGTGIQKGLSKLFTGTSQRIEQALIKPSKVDIEDGFKVTNIQKYGITGNLTQKAQKVEQKLSDLTRQLQNSLKSRTDATVDLVNVFNKTDDFFRQEKGKVFGESGAIKRVLNGLGDEIDKVSATGLVDLTEAQVVKQAAGKKGAWLFGFVEPDARASEMVYSKFYRFLREEIEKQAPEGLKEINKQIGELIPISHAIIRRIPVAERNNVLSLTDLLTGGFAIGNPKAMGLFLLNRALKSGSVANVLGKAGKALEGTPKSAIGQRILGKPFKQGEIPNNYFDNPKLGLSIEDVSKKIHPDDLAVMNDFTEYVAKEYKPKNVYQLELDASRIAERYGIKQPKTLQGLASEFGKILEKYKFKRPN